MVSTPLTARLGMRGARASLAVIIAACSSLAWGHPGHDSGFVHGLLHPALGLDHVLAAVAVGIWGARVGGRATALLPIAFVTAMLAGAALGIAGFRLPLSEAAIAVSVAALGAMIALDARLRPMAGAALLASFALFHGNVHDMATRVDLGAYATGMALGTLVLHGCGIGTAVLLKARPLVLRLAAAPVAFTGLALLAARLG